ncbi:hypothetical protein B0I33_104572 [Prauserella shujinwangii]|uniref:Uncharacterized protein n=1 Tax=Prauserella shujinwangii TaxID=1453103 RepID=A0A2T0LXK2_9PSEU|nr:hypothetical protein [Prauserella shujinwangii]PRX48752.1 hypothetical protein B0I33_104572 [Prauserella shujinwangii]
MTGNRRVAVTSPQTRLAHARRRHRGRWRPATLDPVEAPVAIALYHRQRAQALAALGALVALVAGLPLLLAAVPGLGDVRLLGVPVSWLALVAPFPAMVLLGFWHLRRAERIEEDPDTPAPGRGRRSGASR